MSSDMEFCELADCSKGVFWYLGIVVFIYVVFRLLLSLWRGIYTCFLAHLLGFSVDWKTVGKWAAVTGATDGIGKAYAEALANKGFDVVLISRNPQKLQAVADDIEKKYGVETQVIAVDVTDDCSIYDNIKVVLNDLEVGVLAIKLTFAGSVVVPIIWMISTYNPSFNNVGMSYKYAEYISYVENGEKLADDLIKANMISCTRMTQIVLPQMEKRRKGVIINISSLSAISPVPLLSIYSACKAYVNFFTRAIQEEYKTKGIIIQSVLPGFVSTNMSKMRPSFTTCTPEAFVYWSLKTVGVEDKTYGYPIHKLQGYVQETLWSVLPETMNLALAHHMMNKIRVRYYKKFGLTEKKFSGRDLKVKEK